RRLTRDRTQVLPPRATPRPSISRPAKRTPLPSARRPLVHRCRPRARSVGGSDVPAEQRGSAYRLKTKGKWGVRWREHGRLLHKSPFNSKTEALNYYRDEIAPRLAGHGSEGRRLTFREFAIKYLAAHSANVQPSTIHVLRERLGLPLEKEQATANPDV